MNKFCITYALVVYALFALTTSAPLNGPPKVFEQGLYSPNEDVEILDVNNLKKSIYNSDRAWLVEFYNSWCGFCQRFAPSWKEFATDVKNWKDLVVIAAINCADDNNYPLCAEFNVTKYPTVKYFPKRYPEGQGGVEVAPGVSAYDHRKRLIETMRDDQSNGTADLPNLQPYEGEVDKVFDGAKYALLIIQYPSDTVGPEMILDFHKVKDVSIKYAYNSNTRVMSFLGVNRVPSIYVVEKSDLNNPKLLTSYSSERAGFASAISRFLQTKNIALPKEEEKNNNINVVSNNTPTNPNDLQIEDIKNYGDAVFQVDLENALKYSLTREVGALKSIVGEKRQILQSYMDLLDKHFPFGAQGKLLIKRIKYYVDSAPEVDGTHISALVREATEDPNVFSAKTNWVGCKGSAPFYRGYPCGLWKLFHYLTVNAAQAQTGSNPGVVLQTMHGYIKNFFGCAECSNHFLEMAERRNIFNVSSWDESVLWLWRAHNEVNKRLSKDQTEDPEFPKMQFPTKYRCPACYNLDDSWNESEVLKYLKNMYSSRNVKYVGSDERVAKLTDPVASSSGIPTFGSSILPSTYSRRPNNINAYNYQRSYPIRVY